jgi:diaminopimelate epimerase
MTSSRWDAQGNIYLVTEDDLTPERVRLNVGDADGFVEILRHGDDWAEVAIWNRDGSRAEMSGNGTRIAARWVAERSGGEEITITVGPREVRARILDGPLVEQDLGEITVFDPEDVAGVRLTVVDVGNPHAVVEDDPARLPELGPLLESHERFPRRTNVQVAQPTAPGEIVARVWERGAGETASSGSSAVAIAAAFGCEPVRVRFPGGPLDVRFEGRRAFLTGPAERVS